MASSLLSIPGEGNFQLIKSLVGFKTAIEGKLKRFPYEKNVFMMLKFRDSNRLLSDFIIQTLEGAGLRGVRADSEDWDITGNVFNPLAVLYCCKFGIALFDEAEVGQAYSPNVCYELGIMHIQEKQCLILRHESLPPVPFDLIKDLYKPYNRDLQVREAVQDWVKRISQAPNYSRRFPNDLRLRKTADSGGLLWDLTYGRHSGPQSVFRVDNAIENLRSLFAKAESGEVPEELEDRVQRTWKLIDDVFGAGREGAKRRLEVMEMLTVLSEKLCELLDERDERVQRLLNCREEFTWRDRAPQERLSFSLEKLRRLVERAESGEAGVLQEFETRASRETLPLIEAVHPEGRSGDHMRNLVRELLAKIHDTELD